MSRARGWRIGLCVLACAAAAGVQTAAAERQEGKPQRTGRQIYETTCITCHGPDGKGKVNPELTKVITLPDFTDCAFARREPDADWVAVAHGGGPSRGFSKLMPPWGAMFSVDELKLAVQHVRTFCSDTRWPRGELNLPRPLVTGKAFPEDEVVVSTSGNTSGDGKLVTKFIYERRIGSVNQVEVSVPVSAVERSTGAWASGVGDIALGYKRTLAHDHVRGHIVSVSGEVVLPVASERRGLGGGVTVFEPFATFGQLLPHDSFVQAQAGFEIPASDDHDTETFWRVTLGRSFQQGRFGRTWSPMVELLGVRPIADAAATHWDVVPQVQITLNRRQHIRVNGGVRLPVNDRSGRPATVIVYLLWDWYDGGFFDGW